MTVRSAYDFLTPLTSFLSHNDAMKMFTRNIGVTPKSQNILSAIIERNLKQNKCKYKFEQIQQVEIQRRS